MKFWRRRNSGGKHRAPSAKELKNSAPAPRPSPPAEEPLQKQEQAPLEPAPIPQEEKPLEKAAVAETPAAPSLDLPAPPTPPKLRSALPVGGQAAQPPVFLQPKETVEELPELLSTPAYEVPTDDVSRKTYLLFLEAELDSDAYRHPLKLLARRASLIDRITNLNQRIDKLTGDAKEREDELDELKLDKHIEELEALPDLDEDESQRETLEETPGFSGKRQALEASVLLLARLEGTRAALIKEYKALVEEFVGLLPHQVHDQLEQEIREDIGRDLEVFTHISHHATSEGEWSGDSEATLEELEEFLRELEEDESGPLVSHKGDSLFHLE